VFFTLFSDTSWQQNGCTTSTGELTHMPSHGTCPTSVDWCSSAASSLARLAARAS